MLNLNLLPPSWRRREPGPWRSLALLFPLAGFLMGALLQISAKDTVAWLEAEHAARELHLLSLQADLDALRRLQSRRARLSELLAIRDSLRGLRIVWSNELFAMLETLPSADEAGRPRVAFSELVMQPLSPDEREQRKESNLYEGHEALAEISVRGTASSTEALSEYIASLQRSPFFGVAFNSTSRDDGSSLYEFDMTIGALAAGGRDGP